MHFTIQLFTANAILTLSTPHLTVLDIDPRSLHLLIQCSAFWLLVVWLLAAGVLDPRLLVPIAVLGAML